MKILAIIATPTKDAGYTVRTVKALEKSLQRMSDAHVDYLYPEDVRLSRCQGH